MYYVGARWFDAEAGRFAGVDPLVGNAGNPQDLNAYGYVRNDPVNMVDPTGMVGSTKTAGIEEITVVGTRGSGGSSFGGKLSFRPSIQRYGVSVFSFGGRSLFAGGFGVLPGFTSIQFGMALDGYGQSDTDEGDGSARGDAGEAEGGAANPASSPNRDAAISYVEQSANLARDRYHNETVGTWVVDEPRSIWEKIFGDRRDRVNAGHTAAAPTPYGGTGATGSFWNASDGGMPRSAIAFVVAPQYVSKATLNAQIQDNAAQYRADATRFGVPIHVVGNRRTFVFKP
jgi:hypothetical protein